VPAAGIDEVAAQLGEPNLPERRVQEVGAVAVAQE
jgi:hypothetical protein